MYKTQRAKRFSPIFGSFLVLKGLKKLFSLSPSIKSLSNMIHCPRKDFEPEDLSSTSTIDCVQSVNFFKSVLSFMDEDNLYFEEDSGFSSACQTMEFCPTSGNLSSVFSESYSESVYQTSKCITKLALTWSPTAAGCTVSSRENFSRQPLKQPPKEFFTEADMAKTPTQQNLLFIKYLKMGLLPDIQNHPVKKNKGIPLRSNPGPSKMLSPDKEKLDNSVFSRQGTTKHSMLTSTPIKFFTNSKMTQRQMSSGIDRKVCSFCQKNGEPEQVYVGHTVKDPEGMVTCPILQKYTCELCGATGRYSHTRKYCPLNKDCFKYLHGGQPTYKKLKNGMLIDEFFYYR